MAISEIKMQIVIANYFKSECDTDTSIRQAFEKGFRIGVEKGASVNSPLIEIDEPNGILANDIRKVIASIDPHMIIATTYDEQIERAKAVKNWLLSIVGERRE